MKINFLPVLFVIQALSLHAQNDACTNAIEIFPSNPCTIVTGTFEGIAQNTQDVHCTPAGAYDVWYYFTATNSLTMIDMQTNVTTGQGFEMYSGSCTGENFACGISGPSASGGGYWATDYVVGQTYYIRIFIINAEPSTITYTICVTADTPAGIEAPTVQAGLFVFPNPVTDKIFINGLTGLQSCSFYLYNQMGQVVKQGVLTQESISVDEVPAGNYVLKITDGTQTNLISRIIKV